MSNINRHQEAVTDAVLAASLEEQKEKGPNLRQLHPKSHGLLKGKLLVDENIPGRCKVGVFAKAQEYEVLIRFSNGSSPIGLNEFNPDKEGDVRGMAIKLKNVEGEKVLSDEPDTQDFILINHHVFFLPDVQGYVDFGELRKAKAKNILPDQQLIDKLKPSLSILGNINQKKIGNPLCIQYWSTTPYKLGYHHIKFALRPRDLEEEPKSTPDSPNYLREAMVAYLTEREAVFDFFIQFYEDDLKTPIENPMQEWKEADSPYYKVASILIEKQDFDSEKSKSLDESLSFTPWHTLLEHEPVGSINLSRKKIYQEGAKARREVKNI